MAENGYLDKVINNIANYMSDPEVMEAMLEKALPLADKIYAAVVASL